MVLRAQAAGDGIAVEPRHHDVEDHEIIDVRFCIFQAGQAVVRRIDGKAPAVSSVCSESASRRSSSTTRIFIITAPAGYSP